MRTFKVVRRRTEVLTKEVEAENELHALRLFREDVTIADREWENDSTMIFQVRDEG